MSETFTIYAEDGEYREDAPGIDAALRQFHRRHPNLFVAAVVADAMRPRLVPEDTSPMTPANESLTVQVSGLHVIVTDGARDQVYQFEPDGESFRPGTAPDGRTWYAIGQQAVTAAAADDSGRFSTAELAMLGIAAAAIREMS